MHPRFATFRAELAGMLDYADYKIKKNMDKSKIIIQNDSDLSMADCLRLVEKVIEHGRVSNNETQYAYLTAFSVGDKNYHIVTDLNKYSDKFTIYNVHSV